MSKEKLPVTPAIRVLREFQVAYTPHLYKYEERGGTTVSAHELGVDEHQTIKTIIMEDERRRPLIVLMHGDREISIKELARFLKIKTVVPCQPEVANKHSGYLVGGTSPFGTHKPMPVYMEATILELPRIYINGGKRGFLVEIRSEELLRVLHPTLVKVGIAK
jgi:Cys-tRNA(Pro) deacylase